MLKTERKQAVRQSLAKSHASTEFFTLQMDYHHKVCGGTSVLQSSLVLLYIQILSVQMYSTVVPHLSNNEWILKPEMTRR